ncbi:MAG: hypothetical protein EA406_02365 [Rhodospirillales bacterium]|nr:MAG: hypothetical protein EA406_02365 [Rhodospirillales bacterium]
MTLEQAVQASLEGRAWADLHADTLARYQSLRTDPRSPLHDRMASMARLQDLAADWERQLRLRAEAEAAVHRALADAVLLACGFDRRAGVADRLVALAPMVWQRPVSIDWVQSAVQAGPERFADVRVLPSPQRAIEPDRPTDATVELMARQRLSGGRER